VRTDNQFEIGIDIGGTFTDIVCWMPGGNLNVVKLPTTHGDPGLAVTEAIKYMVEAWGVRPHDIAHFSHGTTLATNAVIERRGARIGLIATNGFSDVIEIGRQFRRATYDLVLEPEAPVFLVPGNLRKDVRERVTAQGGILVPLDEQGLVAAAGELIADGVDAIAICFLFSFANSAHELRARALINEAFPDVMISLSCEVDPAFREYERTCVTAFDAYVKPILDRYLQNMERDLRSSGIGAQLQIMLSRGGKCSSVVARRRPVRLFLSGPASGVIGGSTVGKEAGADDIVTFDMGGTSCDIALISGGKPLISPEGEIAGYPVRVPQIDVNAIGAGGGSVAWIDSAGALRVGPRSAGSEPGPACYGRGGEEATVTDASVVLGYLNPTNFAGGTLTLLPELSRRVIEDKIARPLSMAVEDAALGIHRVVNAQMAEGIRFVSVYRGHDARDFTLLPMGGAGPLHACAIARELGMGRIIVPLRPGVLSACGLLIAPVEHEVSSAFLRPLAETSIEAVRAALDGLDLRCAELMATESVHPDAVRVEHFADVCYVGQSYYLEVPVVHGDGVDALGRLYDDFRNQNERIYGHSTDSPAQIVNLRSVYRANAERSFGEAKHAVEQTMETAATRNILSPGSGDRVEAVVRDRLHLAPGDVVDGPAIIEQSDTTTLIEAGWRARVDSRHNLVLTME